MLSVLSRADLALGRLDGASEILPNPELFVFSYVRREAVLSSQIEGTEASLMDILEFEAKTLRPKHPKDVGEVVNYVAALNFGIHRTRGGSPISLPLLKQIHGRLLKGVRGAERRPGRFRSVQNWIGPPGCTISDAIYIPPAVPDMNKALRDLEGFIGSKSPLPPLIKVGLVHSQFETIHPFLDGNGRMGRLLITLLLTGEGHIRRPLLYLSHFFKRYRSKYYDSLQAVRDSGDWEGWLKFFLQGVSNVSKDALERSIRITALREKHRQAVMNDVQSRGGTALVLLDALFTRPVVDVRQVRGITGLSHVAAGGLVSRLEAIGVLKEVTGHRRNRVFHYTEYLKLLET
jgi:Fic family protein